MIALSLHGLALFCLALTPARADLVVQHMLGAYLFSLAASCLPGRLSSYVVAVIVGSSLLAVLDVLADDEALSCMAGCSAAYVVSGLVTWCR